MLSHQSQPPALRLLPPPANCKPLPRIERPDARVRWVGNVAFVTFIWG